MDKDQVFQQIVDDIQFVFPHISLEVAENFVATLIMYPKMLVELSELVKEKKLSLAYEIY
jgi:hypothetical protein